MKQLKFYNVATKKSFNTDKYKLVTKSGRNFAVANKDGHDCYRIVSKK